MLNHLNGFPFNNKYPWLQNELKVLRSELDDTLSAIQTQVKTVTTRIDGVTEQMYDILEEDKENVVANISAAMTTGRTSIKHRITASVITKNIPIPCIHSLF